MIGGTMGFAVASAEPAKKAAKPNLLFHGTGFEPMTLHIVAGETIEIQSVARNALELMSAPAAPVEIRRTIAPGAGASLRFKEPGLYLLYDAATTRFDKKVGQVVAERSAKQFPFPAYAIALVTTANGRGLAPTTSQIAIPDSYMTFEPWAIVVEAGKKITFINNDMDMHIVTPSTEPMIMSEFGGSGSQLGTTLWLEKMQSFAPITLKPGGGRGVLTLSEPGLHHYFCPIHAAYNATAYTFAPFKSYGGYPFIMDGVIVVLPV
jgi:plastocyanin